MKDWAFQTVEVPITVTLSAYTANDVVGGTLTSDAITQISGGGYIQQIRLIDDATQAEAYKLWVFQDAPSTIADSGAHAPTVADYTKLLGVIDIPSANYRTDGTAGDCAFAAGKDEISNEYITFEPLASGSLYFRLVAVATPDYAAATDLTLHLMLAVE